MKDGQLFQRYVPALEVAPFMPEIARLSEPHFFGPFYMFRAELLGDVRFQSGLTHCEDLVFFFQIAAQTGVLYGGVEGCVYEYTVRPDSAMSNLVGIENGYVAYVHAVQKSAQVEKADLDFLKKKISMIMLKSWLRVFRPVKAISAFLKFRNL